MQWELLVSIFTLVTRDFLSCAPSGKFEISLMIQDRSFHADGSLAYPARE
jgi:hypothetical protein